MKTAKIDFSGVGDRDVYNITAPFQYQDQTVIAGRVEPRDKELSEIMLFCESSSGEWLPMNGAQTFPGLQDPCVTRISDKLLLGGVRFPVEIGADELAWQMEFYLEGANGQFERIFTGPGKMKDIRFAQLPDDQILILTRPQGDKGGRGKIGFVVVDHLADLHPGTIENAPLFDLCPAEQWVGGNEIHPLENGLVGVLGHIANFDPKGNRHYYAMSFCFDPTSGEHSPCEIIGRRDDFPSGEAKRPDLVDVIFSGGLLRLPKGRAKLYAGLSDAEAGWLELEDPFSKV